MGKKVSLKDYYTNLIEDIEILIENEKLYILAPLRSPTMGYLIGYINLEQNIEKTILTSGKDYDMKNFSMDKLSTTTKSFLNKLSDWMNENYEVLKAFEEEKITEKQLTKLLVEYGGDFSLIKKALLKKNILLSYIKNSFKVNKDFIKNNDKNDKGNNKKEGLKMTEKTFKRLVIGAVVFAVIVILAFASLTVISPTQRGVKITLGKAGDTVIQPGLVLKTPFVQSVKKYDLSPKTLKMTFSMGQDAAVTSDMQSVACEMVVYWTYDEAKLLDVVNGYSDSSIKSLVESNTLGAIKEVIGKYSIYDIVEKQEEVTAKVGESLKGRLEKYPINISSLSINNYDWSAEFDAQIATTMKMAQQVKVAEQELAVTRQQAQKQVAEANAAKEKAEIEAKMRVTVAEQEALAREKTATGQANAEKIAADAEAYKAKVEADAEAYAREVQGKAEATYYGELSKYTNIITTMRQLDIDETRASRWDGTEVGQYIPLTAAGGIVTLNK